METAGRLLVRHPVFWTERGGWQRTEAATSVTQVTQTQSDSSPFHRKTNRSQNPITGLLGSFKKLKVTEGHFLGGRLFVVESWQNDEERPVDPCDSEGLFGRL